MKELPKNEKLGPSSIFEEVLKQWEEDIPKIVDRSKLTAITGGIINSKYIANLMSRSEGPVGTRIGKKVLILRDDLIDWLRERQVKDIKKERKN